jgi:hypothetical protein
MLICPVQAISARMAAWFQQTGMLAIIVTLVTLKYISETGWNFRASVPAVLMVQPAGGGRIEANGIPIPAITSSILLYRLSSWNIRRRLIHTP